MGIVIKQSVTNAIISYIGIALGSVLTVLLYPHILSPDQYGLTRVLISASLISAQFAHLGIRNSIIRFFPFFRKINRQQHGLLFWSLLIPFIGFIIFGILFWIFRDLLINYYRQESPLFTDYYLWVLPITLFILYFEVLNSYLRSLRDSTTGSVVHDVLQRIFVIGFLILYFFDLISFQHFILLFVLSYGAQPVILLFQIYRMGEFKLVPNFKLLRKPLVKGISNYGLYSLLGGLTTIMVWNVDILMLGSMAGLADTAIYAIAFYIGSVITVPQRSIEKIATPLISDFIQKKEWLSVKEIYQKTSLNQLISGIFVFGLIWINIDLLFNLLPDIYAGGKWVVLIIGIGKLFDLATGANGSILINSKHYQVAFYANSLLIGLTIALNYMLIPVYGIVGAAIATAFSVFFYNFVKFIYVWIKLNMQPFNYKSLIISFLGAGTIAISSQYLNIESEWLDIFIKNIFFLFVFMAPLIYFRFSPDLNLLLQKILKF